MIPTAMAAEISVRVQPRSPVMGMTNTPNPFLAPIETNSAKKPAPRTIQP